MYAETLAATIYFRVVVAKVQPVNNGLLSYGVNVALYSYTKSKVLYMST